MGRDCLGGIFGAQGDSISHSLRINACYEFPSDSRTAPIRLEERRDGRAKTSLLGAAVDTAWPGARVKTAPGCPTIGHKRARKNPADARIASRGFHSQLRAARLEQPMYNILFEISPCVKQLLGFAPGLCDRSSALRNTPSRSATPIRLTA
jgi:hypothetical protein